MIEEMNRRYCLRNGWHLKPGEVFNAHKTFLPYFCVDTAFQEFLKFKYSHKLARENKKRINRISEAFSAYFAWFRAIFTPEQQEYLLELTDRFEEFIPHHVLIAQVAYMNAVRPFMDFEKQKESASIWVVNMLAAAGQGWHGIINPLNSQGGRRIDLNIGTVCTCSRDLSDSLFGTNQNYITEEASKGVNNAIQVLVNVVERWVGKMSDEHHEELKEAAEYDSKIQKLREMYQPEKKRRP